MKAEPITHDFTRMGWGHNIEVIGGNRIAGWSTPRPREGDLVKWIAKSGERTYRLVNVELCADPCDMWFASCVDPDESADNALAWIGVAIIVIAIAACVDVLL